MMSFRKEFLPKSTNSLSEKTKCITAFALKTFCCAEISEDIIKLKSLFLLRI